MVEVTKEALADARRWMCALPRDQFDKLLVLGEDARQAGVQQGLDMAAAYIQTEYPFDKRKLVPAIRKLGGGDA